jgi:hypothetical protein
VTLANGALNELLMADADLGVDDALATCDHLIDMVLRRHRADQQ